MSEIYKLWLILMLSLCLLNDSKAYMEFDGWINIELQHTINANELDRFVYRANVSTPSLNSGLSKIVGTVLTTNNLENLKKLSRSGDFYRLQAIVEYSNGVKRTFLTASKACNLLSSQLHDELWISVDASGYINAVSLSTSAEDYNNDCSTMDASNFPAKEFNTQVLIKHTELAPVPDTASFIQKIEREREARERGESKDNRGFFAKYSQQPSERFNPDWSIPSDIQLADPQFNIPQRIDLLLSSAVFFDLLLDGKICLGNDLPSLINTSLGWIIGGKVNLQPSHAVSSCHVTTLNDLDASIRAFWEIEEFPRSKLVRSKEEIQCENHFVKVRLPFKSSVNQLGNSFEPARRRFLAQEKRLQSNEAINNVHTIDFMREYIELNHMSIVNYETLNRPHYVIPHHSVLRLQSSSTKLRVVFDASACTSSNISLNDLLMVGPTI